MAPGSHRKRDHILLFAMLILALAAAGIAAWASHPAIISAACAVRDFSPIAAAIFRETHSG